MVLTFKARGGAGKRAVLLALVLSCAARQKNDATARDPRDLGAIRARIEAARKQGGLEPLLRELRTEPREAVQFYALGLAEFAAGNEQAAISALRKAAELKPNEADIQYRLGVALLDGEKFAEAREPLQKAAQLAPKV